MNKKTTIVRIALIALIINFLPTELFSASDYFAEVKADSAGDFLWSEALNWSIGLPSGSDDAKLGDTGGVVHATVKQTGNVCNNLIISNSSNN